MNDERDTQIQAEKDERRYEKRTEGRREHKREKEGERGRESFLSRIHLRYQDHKQHQIRRLI